MRLLRDLPVKHKITAITLITILVVSVLSSGVFVVIESRAARAAIVAELNTIAGILADNTVAALAFNDPAAAEETLSFLKATPNIIAARVLRSDGRVFAAFPPGAPPSRSVQPRHATPFAAAGPEDAGAVTFRDNEVEVRVPVRFDHEVVGTIVLRSNLDKIAEARAAYLTIAAAVVLLSMAIAYLLISRMQRVISRPIERLLQTMHTVSQSRDYSVRAPAHGRDELGSLIDGFNQMLEQTQRHEERLRTARQEAEAANQAKSEILANMSHELRTPLNAILGFSEILMDESATPPGTARYREYARDINQSGRHLLAVINDILDISKIEAGRMEIMEDLIEPAALTENALRLIHERAVQAEVEVRLSPQDDLPRLMGDERLIKQALLNILSNAVKFTPAGGRVEVHLALDHDGAMVFSVRDTGIGIAKGDLQHVLTPFGQVDSSLSRSYQGTGLGLPLTKSFLELHGGTLELRSALGEGTEVTLRFPAARVERRGKPRAHEGSGAISA